MTTEEFYQSLYHDIFLKWILLNAQDYMKDNITCQVQEESDISTTLLFHTNKMIGRVTIWHNNIVEEEIKQKNCQDNLFYLHYKIVDLGQAKSLFKEFYHTLMKHNQQKLIKIANSLKQTPHPQIKTKAMFMMMRFIQLKKWSACQKDYDYWQEQGWLSKKRPWKSYE